MKGGETKIGSVFSWADEVEKEEQEEEASEGSCQAQPQQWQKKPNPFGSARPREFVLQDRGIDWKQLDLHLHQSSPLPHEFHQNEMMQKQSNHQPATPVLNSKPPVRSPQVISTPQIPSPTSLLPPLRYPPKYVAGFLYEHWASSASNASGYQHFKPEKENRSPGRGKSNNNLKSESALCDIGNTGRRRTIEVVEAKEAQQRGKNSERMGNFHGLPLVNQKLGRQPWNIRDASGMYENKSVEHKWQKVTKKRHCLPVSQVNGGFNQKLMGDRTGLGRNKVKNFEKEGIKLNN